MAQIYTEVSQILDVPPEQIDQLLNEYRDGERSIMPQPYFMDLRREDNADSIGHTVVATVKFSSVEHEFKETVYEDYPLRFMMEYDAENETMVLIVVEPIRYTEKTRITITTIYANHTNFSDFVEDILIPGNLHHIYEFHQFAQQMQTYDEIRQVS